MQALNTVSFVQCDAANGQAVSSVWTLRASLLTYFMALTATIGGCSRATAVQLLILTLWINQ